MKGMKKIDEKSQKKIMIDILKYFDEICRNNNIKYSFSYKQTQLCRTTEIKKAS